MYWEKGQGSRKLHVICRQMKAEIMGLNVSVHMGYNIKGTERGASRLGTDPGVKVAAAWSSPRG